MEKKICSVEGCEKLSKARGLCDAHYKAKQRSGELKTATYEKRGTTCSVKGCNRSVYSKKLCNIHYQRFMKYGTTSEESLKHKTCSMNLEERFNFYSSGPDNEKGCHIWQGSVSHDGYGVVWWKNYPYRAHRVSYLLHNGEIPDGMLVCHKCNNKLCVNPDHLYLGTIKKNLHDAIRDGLITWKSGSQSYSSKLTKAEAIEIIQRKKKGEDSKSIAKDFDVTFWTVDHVAKGKTWKELDYVRRGSRRKRKN